MPATALSLYCAAAAMLGAAYVHGMLRFADAMQRKGVVGRRDWIVLPLLIVMVGLLYLEFLWLDQDRPDLLPGIGFATFLGLNIGKILPRPGPIVSRSR